MRQFRFSAKIFVRKKENEHSNHAQLYGEVMRQENTLAKIGVKI